MEIEIIGTESLGVRGLCCFVKTKDRRILIDPGIALGYTRYGLLPHPFQVAVDERIQKKIVKRWSEATDIVISHFHGDHVPLADANPYQLNMAKIIGLNPEVRIWTKSSCHLSSVEKQRAVSLSFLLEHNLIEAEGQKQGPMTFSMPVPHGDEKDRSVAVMMTKIEEDGVFVHASDIQLLNHAAVSDHHLMRSFEGLKWIKRLSSEAGKRVICGADFMGKPRRLLEANRKRLYKDMPVPDGWHEAYAKGKGHTDRYWNSAQRLYKLEDQE
jgi:predicted metallo-beta-lactamase superfamily hydrolase